MRKLGFILLVLLMTMPAFAQDDALPDDLVNLDHLKFLTEPVTIEGEDMALVHIYSEFPDYEWVDAAGEGLSAVDDMARAAVVYLQEYDRTGDESLLELARRSLNFVMYMQVENGEFFNFVTDRAGTINRFGGTSFQSLGWWAMRALWALGEGVRVFDAVDPAYADQLAQAYLRTESALGETLGSYGEYINRHGFEIPAWIPGSEPAVAAVGLLGMSAYYQARPNGTTADIMTKIADGIAEYRLGDDSTYPFGMHPARANAPGFWHTWGAHMAHGLVEAGIALDRADWIESAAASADSFLLRQIAFERFRHIGVVPYRLEQIAYGTNMLVQTYASLYRATGEERYARYAGLVGSWYFGNNIAGVQMYDPATGRTFDGINGPVAFRVNRNSGAESTIEALLSLIALAQIPEALPFLQAEVVDGNQYFILEAEDGDRVNGTPVYYPVTWTGEGYVSGGRYIGLGEGQRMRINFELSEAQADEPYLIYAAHMHQASGGDASALIQRIDSAPTIDGDPSDWNADLPTLESNTARQFLRGSGLWQGAEVDSHTVTLAWDDEYLYLLARVRDPEHEQTFTLRNVWQGDTLWLYFTGSPDARSLSAKFTLAQTPEGAQVWDWIGTGFVEGAQLAWQPLDDGDGYIYEAALPWSALEVEQPTAGTQIGFEAGRGVGGDAFMDLTGRDPDIAANLLRLTLTEPDFDNAALSSSEAALEVRINDTEVTLPQMVSPDSDHFWLDLLTPEGIMLNAGENTLRYRHRGEGENPTLAKVDAFYIQPVTARRVFALPDGSTYELTYNTLTGDVAWTELN